MTRDALLDPVDNGEKVTVTVQVAPGATVEQVVAHLKISGPLVAIETPWITRSPVPLLLTVKVLLLDAPTLTVPKAAVVRLTAMAGYPPAPAWLTVNVWPPIVRFPVREFVSPLGDTV